MNSTAEPRSKTTASLEKPLRDLEARKLKLELERAGQWTDYNWLQFISEMANGRSRRLAHLALREH
jgi:hypothetical protein